MKLENASIKKLETVSQLCSTLGIDAILIEDKTVRGVNPDKSCVIISDENVPDFGENRIGVSRLGVLLARINLLKSDPKLTIEAKEVAEKKEISQLTLVGTSAKIQFKCTNPALIKAPKAVNDAPTWVVSLPKTQIDLAINAVKAMGAKRVTICTKDGKTPIIECSDTNQDTFSIDIETDLQWVSEGDKPNKATFVHYYPVEVLLPMLRHASASSDGNTVECIVGEMGTLSINISGHMITCIAQVDS